MCTWPTSSASFAREPIFHGTELGTTRADFEAQTVDDFWEVGASWRRYSREVVWQTLEPRYAATADDPWDVTESHCRELGADTLGAMARFPISQSVRSEASLFGDGSFDRRR
jgi:hypothetical protein